jgi:hypothetical protein
VPIANCVFVPSKIVVAAFAPLTVAVFVLNKGWSVYVPAATLIVSPETKVLCPISVVIVAHGSAAVPHDDAVEPPAWTNQVLAARASLANTTNVATVAATTAGGTSFRVRRLMRRGERRCAADMGRSLFERRVMTHDHGNRTEDHEARTPGPRAETAAHHRHCT